jgi:hypothetical protein
MFTSAFLSVMEEVKNEWSLWHSCCVYMPKEMCKLEDARKIFFLYNRLVLGCSHEECLNLFSTLRIYGRAAS